MRFLHIPRSLLSRWASTCVLSLLFPCAYELNTLKHLQVIYGDTDSVFVNSGVTDLAEALKISAEFKKAVNNQYKLLEIDLDGVFARLLLLQKKKYAAIKVEKENKTSTEIKGLDMKRREYCALSKNVSQYVFFLRQDRNVELIGCIIDMSWSRFCPERPQR